MAQSTTELYTILVQTTGTADIRQLTKELDKSNRAMQQTQTAARGAVQATSGVTKAQKQSALQFQNTGYQIQDFLVQVSAGTGAMRAAGQQLPQLLSGFGLWGVALGTAAAGLGAIAPLLFKNTDTAKAATDAIEALTEATNALYASTEAAAQPLSKFREEYGAFAETAQGLSQIQVEIDTIQAEFAVKRAQTALDALKISGEDALNSWQSLTGQVAGLGFDIANKESTEWSGDLLRQLADVRDAMEVTAEEIKKDTGLSATDFATLTRSIDAINAAIKNNDLTALMTAYRTAMSSMGSATDKAAQEISASLETSVMAGVQAIRLANAEIANINRTAAQGLAESRTEVEKTEQRLDELLAMSRQVKNDPTKFAPDAYEGLLALIQKTTIQLADLREEAQKAFSTPPNITAAWETVTEVMNEAGTAQEQAADKAQELQGVLDLVEQGLLALSPEQIEAVRAALNSATAAANAMSGAVLNIQNSIDSLNSASLRVIAMDMARIQGFSASVAGTIGDTTDDAVTLRKALEEAGGDPTKRNEALKSFSDLQEARRRNLAVNEKYDATVKSIEASEAAAAKAAKGGAKAKKEGSKATSDAEKELEKYRDSLRETSDEAGRLQQEIFALTTDMIKFWDQLTPEEQGLAKQQIAELQAELANLKTELSEVGQIMESSFDSFFGDLVEGTKTAGEAFSDFILGMINDITKFLFSQQVNAFLGLLSQQAGFGFLSAGTQAAVAAPQVAAQTFGLRAANSPTEPTSTSRGMGASAYSLVTPSYIPSATASDKSGLNVNIYNQASGTEISAEEGTDSAGNRTLDIVVRDKVKALVATGALDKEMQRSYGLRRRPG